MCYSYEHGRNFGWQQLSFLDCRWLVNSQLLVSVRRNVLEIALALASTQNCKLTSGITFVQKISMMYA